MAANDDAMARITSACSGREALTYDELASELSKALGRPQAEEVTR